MICLIRVTETRELRSAGLARVVPTVEKRRGRVQTELQPFNHVIVRSEGESALCFRHSANAKSCTWGFGIYSSGLVSDVLSRKPRMRIGFHT